MSPQLRRPLGALVGPPLLAALLTVGCALGAGIEIPSSHGGPSDGPDNEGSNDGGISADGGIAVDPPPVGGPAGTGGVPCCQPWSLGGASGSGGLGGATP